MDRAVGNLKGCDSPPPLRYGCSSPLYGILFNVILALVIHESIMIIFTIRSFNYSACWWACPICNLSKKITKMINFRVFRKFRGLIETVEATTSICIIGWSLSKSINRKNIFFFIYNILKGRSPKKPWPKPYKPKSKRAKQKTKPLNMASGPNYQIG